MIRKVLKLVYIDSENILAYYTIRMYVVKINVFNKENTDFFTTHPIFSLVSPRTLCKLTAFFEYTGTGLSTT